MVLSSLAFTNAHHFFLFFSNQVSSVRKPREEQKNKIYLFSSSSLILQPQWNRLFKYYFFHQLNFFNIKKCWVYNQSPTLARNGENHGYIRMDKYLHWYEAFWE